jgi:hypothetical protein
MYPVYINIPVLLSQVSQQNWIKTSCPAMPLSHTCKQAHTVYKLYKGLDWKSFKLKLVKVYTFYHIVGSNNPLRPEA